MCGPSILFVNIISYFDNSPDLPTSMDKMARKLCRSFAALALAWVLCPFLVFGQKIYSGHFEFCCNGQLHARSATSMCCGATVYDASRFACCGDQLLPLPVNGGRSFLCCPPPTGSSAPSQLYNFLTHKCCQGVVSALPNGGAAGIHTYQCCNDMAYDSRSHLCCNKQVLERGLGEDCCDGHVFNRNRQACCWEANLGPLTGKVLDLEGRGATCCGHQLYDETKNACCWNTVLPLPALNGTGQRLDCCDKEPFYGPEQFCCETLENKNGTLFRTSYKVHTGRDRASCCGACCNTNLVGFKTPGTEYNGTGSCCGGAVVDPAKHGCRDGNVFSILKCGGREYDPSRQMCCGEEVLDMESDFRCCTGSGRKFHKTEEICCGSDVVPITTSDREANRTSCCPRAK